MENQDNLSDKDRKKLIKRTLSRALLQDAFHYLVSR